MSKKRRSRKNVERVKSDDRLLWRLVTDHPDIFDTHILSKLNGNDVKFFYDVNSESRRAVKRSGVQLPDAFKLEILTPTSTISWALEKCLEKRERFCAEIARNGNFVLLKFLHENGCPWNNRTCSEAAYNGHLECLKYAHENGCPWSEWTCTRAAEGGHLECLKYAHENGCPWDIDTCSWAASNGHLECLKYANESGCPWDEKTCSNAAHNGHLRVFEIRARKRMSME